MERTIAFMSEGRKFEPCLPLLASYTIGVSFQYGHKQYVARDGSIPRQLDHTNYKPKCDFTKAFKTIVQKPMKGKELVAFKLITFQVRLNSESNICDLV